VSDRELEEVYSSSDLLVNLRRIDDYAMNFVFPSKLMEYIEKGCPVLTTRLLDDFELNDCLFVADSLDVEEVSRFILDIQKNRKNAYERAYRARKYAEKRYSYDRLAKEISLFIEK
jgi:glycosyltransferase involved in cell wall biosynthesis